MDRPDFVWSGRAMNVLSLTAVQRINIAVAANLANDWYKHYVICRIEAGEFVKVDILVDGRCYYLVPVVEAGG